MTCFYGPSYLAVSCSIRFLPEAFLTSLRWLLFECPYFSTWLLGSCVRFSSCFPCLPRRVQENWIFQCRARVDNGSCIFWLVLLVMMHRTLVVGRIGMLGIWVGRCFTVAVLGHAGDMPVVLNNGCLGFTVPRNCGGSAVAVICRSSTFCRGAEADPPWSSCSEDHGDSAFLVVDAPVVDSQFRRP